MKNLGILLAILCAFSEVAFAGLAERFWTVSASDGQCIIESHVDKSSLKLIGQCENFVNGGLLAGGGRGDGRSYFLAPEWRSHPSNAVVSVATHLIATAGSYVISKNSIAGPKMVLVTQNPAEASRYLQEVRAYKAENTIRDAGFTLQLADGRQISQGRDLDQWVNAYR